MSISTLRTQLEFRGGRPGDRLIKDKERSMKKAIYSYQGQTAILNDGREFKCLINPNKETYEYDDMILSIPFKDVCVNAPKVGKTSEGQVPIGVKCGDTFEWKETATHWLIVLQFLDEVAYFRGQIRECQQETEINGENYWTYIRGPVETDIVWNQKAGIEWNDLNYSLVMFVTKDENTMSLDRFTRLKIPDFVSGEPKTWEVAGVNRYYGEGMVQVFLNEYFENTIEENGIKEKQEIEEKEEAERDKNLPHIIGPSVVGAYSTVTYAIENLEGGQWYVQYENQAKKIYPMQEDGTVKIDILTRKGSFVVTYEAEDKIASITVDVH